MSNQLLANTSHSASNMIQKSQIVEGSIILAGSYGNPEPINWASIVSGIGYNQLNFRGLGVAGTSSALVTAFSASSGTVTATAANRYSVGQKVTFFGCTTTLGKLLNGVTVIVATASTSQFTFLSSATGTGTSETGGSYSGSPFYTAGIPGPKVTASVTSLAVSGGVITVTATNSFVAGATVTFAGLTTALGLLMNGVNFTVASAGASSFTMTSALTGSAGSDTGTATGNNPPVPYDVQFWSANASGYTYAYSDNNANLVIQQGAASASNPSAPIGTGALASAITGDIVRFQAFFLKDQG